MKTPTYEEAVNTLFPESEVLRDIRNGEMFVDGEPLGLDAVAEVWKGLEAESLYWSRSRGRASEFEWLVDDGQSGYGKMNKPLRLPDTGNMLRDWTILAAMAKEAGK